MICPFVVSTVKLGKVSPKLRGMVGCKIARTDLFSPEISGQRISTESRERFIARHTRNYFARVTFNRIFITHKSDYATLLARLYTRVHALCTFSISAKKIHCACVLHIAHAWVRVAPPPFGHVKSPANAIWPPPGDREKKASSYPFLKLQWEKKNGRKIFRLAYKLPWNSFEISLSFYGEKEACLGTTPLDWTTSLFLFGTKGDTGFSTGGNNRPKCRPCSLFRTAMTTNSCPSLGKQILNWS